MRKWGYRKSRVVIHPPVNYRLKTPTSSEPRKTKTGREI